MTARESDPRWVYTFWNEQDECLYVGCTVDFPRRLSAHRAARPWWGQVTRFEVYSYPDYEGGIAAESARIAELKPLHNRAYPSHDTPSRRRRLRAVPTEARIAQGVEYLTVTQAAALMGLSRRGVVHRITNGQIVAVKLDPDAKTSAYMIPRDQVAS